jgi:hypothetical protein
MSLVELAVERGYDRTYFYDIMKKKSAGLERLHCLSVWIGVPLEVLSPGAAVAWVESNALKRKRIETRTRMRDLEGIVRSNQLSRIENDLVCPTRATAEKLATFYQCTVEELFPDGTYEENRRTRAKSSGF